MDLLVLLTAALQLVKALVELVLALLRKNR
jgi:hypothetical protein